MHRSRFNMTSKQVDGDHATSEVPISLRKKGNNRGVLTQKEKLDIVYEAIVNLRKHLDIAKEFRV